MMSPGMNKESMLAFIEADIKFEMKTKRRETRRANEAALQRLQQDAATVVQQRRSQMEESVMERIEAWSPSSPATSQSPSTNAPSSSSASVADGAKTYHHLLHMEGEVRKAERERWREEALGVLNAQELAQCSFAPTINAKSRAMVAEARAFTPDGGKRLHERTPEILAEQRHRRQQLAAEVEAVREAEMKRPLAPPHTPSARGAHASAGSPLRSPKSRGSANSKGSIGSKAPGCGGSRPGSGGSWRSAGSQGSDESFLESVERQSQERRFRMQMLRSNVNFERKQETDTFTPRLNSTTERLAASRDDADEPAHVRLARAKTAASEAGSAAAHQRLSRRRAGPRKPTSEMTLEERIACMADEIAVSID